MNNEQEKNKVDAYITAENLKENKDALSMPIPEHFDAYRYYGKVTDWNYKKISGDVRY